MIESEILHSTRHDIWIARPTTARFEVLRDVGTHAVRLAIIDASMGIEKAIEIAERKAGEIDRQNSFGTGRQVIDRLSSRA